MNTQRPIFVSVIDPIGPAVDAVKTILFRPFNLERWFAIGFCAWLAYLGQGRGGGGSNFNIFGRQSQPHLHQAKEFVLENLAWLIPAAVFLFVLMIVITLLVLWLSSRGQFMFLHCVAKNKAQVKAPWHTFRAHADSLFVFRIVLGIMTMLAALLLSVPLILLVISTSRAEAGLKILPLLGIGLIIIAFLGLAIAAALVLKFTADFVVPIMSLQTTSCLTAWRQFWRLLAENKARFVLYLLFQIVISVAIGMIIIAGACLTCCCLGCILLIPYLGTVIFLPVFVFKRAYSICYLRQFGPALDALVPPAA